MVCKKTRSVIRRLTIDSIKKNAFADCGKNVRLGAKCSFAGIENIYVGTDVSFGEGTRILSTRANIIIGNHVMFAPNVTIISGNHRIDLIGKYMSEVSDAEKTKDNDKDIIIDDDVWIGANSVILSGVHINRGSVVAAGSIVTKDVPPYAIVGGNPAKVIRYRFEDETLQKHKEIIKSRETSMKRTTENETGW